MWLNNLEVSSLLRATQLQDQLESDDSSENEKVILQTECRPELLIDYLHQKSDTLL